MKTPQRSPSGRSAAFSDVESGEGGETIATGTEGVDGGFGMEEEEDTAEPFDTSTVSVTGTGSLQLEVALLSIDAVDRVAAGIARDVSAAAGKAGLAGVVIADPGLIAALRLRDTLMAELVALEAKVANAEAGSGAPAAEAGLVAPAAMAALSGVRRAAQTASKALSVFSVASSYSGRKNVVRPSAMTAALAKHLAGAGIAAQVPRYAVVPTTGSGFFDRLLALQLKCRDALAGGSFSTDITTASQMVDVLLQALFGTNSPDGSAPHAQGRLVQQLAEADMTAAAVAQGCGLLTVELAITGGSYRARKWILNALFGSDGLTYSGGAAATYFLLSGTQMSALASDTLYFATGHGKFRGQDTHFRPSNFPAPPTQT